MAMRSHPVRRRHSKGQADHVDAWLMSYADLITLLFMFFVILISMSAAKHEAPDTPPPGEPPHPYVQQHSGMLALGTPFDELYGNLVGTVGSNLADQDIAVEKTAHGLMIDLSAMRFFAPGDAEITASELPLLKAIAESFKKNMQDGDSIEVESYTDEAPLAAGRFTTDWELAAMRSARVAALLADQGVAPERLRAVSYAAYHPLVPNNDAAGNPIAENQVRNRRVVIRVERPVEESESPAARLH